MQAVLFDLDGTLLDIQLDHFLQRYFAALESAAAPLADRASTSDIMSAINDAVRGMMVPHDGRTNMSVFYEIFAQRTGVDLGVEWPVFQRFYDEVFPGLGNEYGPASGARSAIETARALGLKVAIATNPIFPAIAVRHRMAWAGLDDLDIPVITSYETMTACKPHPEYFRQTASLLGVDTRECLMVGDDRFLDMPAADTGMRTYYVGDDEAAAATYRGDLTALTALLPRLIEG